MEINNCSPSPNKPEPPSFEQISELWSKKMFDSMFEEWWSSLKEQNRNNMSQHFDISGHPKLVLTPAIVDVIFRIARNFKVTDTVRYQALELFDRFVAEHFVYLHNYIWTKYSVKSVVEAKLRLKAVPEQLKKQALLRIMSCIQLASKFDNNTVTINHTTIANFLNELGYNFSALSVKRSEQRVFRAMKYKIPLGSIVTYVEHLVMVLRDTVDDCDRLYDTCLKVLDVATAEHRRLYEKLFHLLNTKWQVNREERACFKIVECDNVLLSAAVVASAATICEGFKPDVLPTLASVCELSTTDVETLAAILVEIVLAD